MLDVKLIRSNPEIIKLNLSRRGTDTGIIDEFLSLDEKKRKISLEAEQLRALRNQVSGELAKVKSSGGDISEQSAKMREVGARIKDLEAESALVEEKALEIISGLPNLPDESVPDGKDESDNPEIKRWGELPQFDFPPLAHWDIGEKLDILDSPRAVKLSRARFVLLKNQGAQLERAIINFMLDTHTRRHGYREIAPPYLVSGETMYGTGQLPKFEEDLFKVQPHNLYLIPTAEVPLTNLHRDEILDGKTLPIYYAGYTACFRSEAGAAGKDTRGMIRVHQFDKVELVKFTRPEDSYAELEKMVEEARYILEALKLPHRLLRICIGDLGFSAAKKYDLEVWSPGQDKYVEISSLSNCTEFQARRAQIRFKDSVNDKPQFVHTLNGSGLAVGRTLAMILENYQQKDGSVIIPEVLRPYLNGLDKIAL